MPNNYGNFGALYYEKVDRYILLYKFHLQTFCRVTFNNAIKKVLPILLFELILKGTYCGKMTYCDYKNVLTCKGSFTKKTTNEFIEMTSTFAFMCVD